MKTNLLLKFSILALSSSALANDRVLPTSAQTSMAVLGKGYDRVKEAFVGDCVSGNVLYAGAPYSSVSFDRSMSAQEAADSLGFSVGVKARYGVVTASAAARFASDSSSSDYSEATVYSAEYFFKNAKMSAPDLTSTGKTAFGTGSFTGENWDLSCGHEYVEQIRLGAKIFISAKVDFATKEDKMAFAAEFKIKGPAFSASGELKKASRRFGKTASVTIRAYQLGGDVSRISSIFGSGPNAKVDVDGKKVHALLACSMDNVAACTQILDNALTYATDTQDSRAFPNQIKPNYDPHRPDGPAELAYITKPWSDLAYYPQPPIMTAVIKEARAELSRTFEDLLLLRNRVTALITGTFRLSPRQKAYISGIERNISANLVKITEAVEVCYSDAQKCPAHILIMKDQLIDNSHVKLEIYPEIFSQWCDAADSGVIKRDAKEIIKRLVAIADTDLDLSKVGDKCGEAEHVLRDRKFIDISSYDSWDNKVRSLTPLASLVNIEVLWMAHNQIENLEALQDLSKLRELNINSNLVKDLSPIAHLTNLESLKVNGNKVRNLPTHLNSWLQLHTLEIGSNSLKDLAPLVALRSLSRLYAGNNDIRSISEIEKLNEIQMLDLSNNQIRDFSPLEKLTNLLEADLDHNIAKCPDSLESQCFKMDL
jgi:hypothetical protein